MYLSLLKGSARFTTVIPVEVLGYFYSPPIFASGCIEICGLKNYTPSEGLEITAHFKEFLNKEIYIYFFFFLMGLTLMY